MILMVSVGFHFGTFLSFYPILMADYYGYVNFGMCKHIGPSPSPSCVKLKWISSMNSDFGYMQFASSIATFAIPNVATTIYNSMVMRLAFFLPLMLTDLPVIYYQGDYNIMFILLACFLASSSVIIFFKTPTPIGTVW